MRFKIVETEKSEWKFEDAIKWLMYSISDKFEYRKSKDLEVFTRIEGETITLFVSTVDGMLLREWDLESPSILCYFESWDNSNYFYIPPDIRKAIQTNIPELLKIAR